MEAHTKIAAVAGWVLYLFGVVALEGLFLALSGRVSEASQLALVTSTLVFATLLRPLRLGLGDYIERRLREERALSAAREAQGPITPVRELMGEGGRMRAVGQFLDRFWVAVLALSILLLVMSPINLVKLARKTWGWWR